jgi:hypothetical protein
MTIPRDPRRWTVAQLREANLELRLWCLIALAATVVTWMMKP